MLTVKVIEPNLQECVFEASTVEFFPTKVTLPEYDIDPGVIIGRPDGTTCHYGFTVPDPEKPSYKTRNIFVMNDKGATVANYGI